MAKHGGKRKGAGRKPKADEIKLIENMDAVLARKTAWEALAGRVEEGDTQAIKTWLAYRYGQPKQSIDLSTLGESINKIERVIIDPSDE